MQPTAQKQAANASKCTHLINPALNTITQLNQFTETRLKDHSGQKNGHGLTYKKRLSNIFWPKNAEKERRLATAEILAMYKADNAELIRHSHNDLLNEVQQMLSNNNNGNNHVPAYRHQVFIFGTLGLLLPVFTLLLLLDVIQLYSFISLLFSAGYVALNIILIILNTQPKAHNVQANQ